MFKEQLLTTIVHISDLHFGDLGPQDDAALSAAVVDWWRIHPLFDGYLGHHGIALRHLDDFMAMMNANESPILLITGDITANGGEGQFDLARRYLSSTITLSSSDTVGLEMPQVHRGMIPGNHDHWPGRTATSLFDLGICGGRTHAFGALFPQLPLPVQRISLSNGLTMVLLGIDTDSDIASGFPCIQRFFARGNFVSQLTRLEEQIGSPRADEIRVLMLHHSPMHDGFVLGISNKSRRALDRFVKRCGISVLLTGHLHEPGARKLAVEYRGASWNILEARSGTTTRRDELPLQWAERNQPLSPNTLLVHRLYEMDRNRVEWRTNLFQRFLTGFRDRGPILTDANSSVVVWPRL